MPQANAQIVVGAIEQLLDLSPLQPGYVPSLNIGEAIKMVSDSTEIRKRLADPNYEKALLTGNRSIALPVILGDSPFSEATCVGFITVQVVGVEKDSSSGLVDSWTCKLVKDPVRGTGGLIDSITNPSMNNSMQIISAGTVHLVN